MERQRKKKLDAALDSLDMLSTVTNARKEYMSEMRLRGIRSVVSGASSSRRIDIANQSFTPTKENLLEGLERTMLYCASGSSKVYLRRPKYRPTPYDISNRKPLNSLVNPMSRLGLGATTRSRTNSSSESRSQRHTEGSEEAAALTFPHIFDDAYHQLPFRDALNHSKTEQFPVPLLSRSKSLEDLRESPNKSKSKSVRFQLTTCDDNSNGTASSSGSNSLESPLSLSPRTSFFNVLKGEVSIKNEIESMSMLIEKLDVA